MPRPFFGTCFKIVGHEGSGISGAAAARAASEPRIDFVFKPPDAPRSDLDPRWKAPGPHLGIEPRVAVADLLLDLTAAQDAAGYLGLPLTVVPVGLAGLERELATLLTDLLNCR